MSADYAMREQLPPVPSASLASGPAITDLVVADLLARDAVGVERYGVRLRHHNGRDALVDLYQEGLDAVKYARQLLEEGGERYQLIYELALLLVQQTRRALYERDGQ